MSLAMAASPKAAWLHQRNRVDSRGLTRACPAYHAAKVNKIYVLMARFDVL